MYTPPPLPPLKGPYATGPSLMVCTRLKYYVTNVFAKTKWHYLRKVNQQIRK